MKQILYREENQIPGFLSMIEQFGKQSGENELILDAGTGDGRIRFYSVEAGLQLRIWDCRFHESFVINRVGMENTPQKCFSLLYFLTPGNFLTTNNLPGLPGVSKIWNNVFASNDSSFEIMVKSGCRVRCVCLSISWDWLHKNMLNTIRVESPRLRPCCQPDEPLLVFDSMNAEESGVIDELMTTSVQSSGTCTLPHRALIFRLLSGFLSKHLPIHTDGQSSAACIFQKMDLVKRELDKAIFTGFPGLRYLSGKAAMGETLVKKYFRLVYKTSLYSYFQEKRLTAAWRLLTEEYRSVSETAYLMGYSTAAHFTEAFRRQFGLLPGKFRCPLPGKLRK